MNEDMEYERGYGCVFLLVVYDDVFRHKLGVESEMFDSTPI